MLDTAVLSSVSFIAEAVGVGEARLCQLVLGGLYLSGDMLSELELGLRVWISNTDL